MEKFIEILKSFANIFYLNPTIYTPEIKKIINQTGEEALRSDWETIGKDFDKIIPNYHDR